MNRHIHFFYTTYFNVQCFQVGGRHVRARVVATWRARVISERCRDFMHLVPVEHSFSDESSRDGVACYTLVYLVGFPFFDLYVTFS